MTLSIRLPWLALASLFALAPSPAHASETPIKLDVLFVIDNSGSMGDEQESLAANFPRFMDELAALPGGLPDLHLAVVSTNLGAGGAALSGCEGAGDDGVFQNAPRTPGCSVPDGRFIRDELGGEDGGRVRNYPGSLPETFSCIARLGTLGCGFEQPLAALERALDGSRPENAGFLREDAYLAVVVIADEDDCSASQPATLFDPSSDALGALTSFRCSAQGVSCDGAPLPGLPGVYENCEPRFDAPLVTSPATTVAFLNGLKSDPDRLLVAAIVGDAGPLRVVLDGAQRPQLASACTDESQNGDGAAPAVRTTWFAAQFVSQGEPPNVRSICDNDLSGALSRVGASFRRAIVASDDAPIATPRAGCAVAPAPRAGLAGAWLACAALALALSSRPGRARRG